MINRYIPHLVVIPEDDKNRQIIGGFRNHHAVDNRRFHVEPVAGGWRVALRKITSDHEREMVRYNHRYLLLLIDFDGIENRLDRAKEFIPEALSDRVFIMGCRSEPEYVRRETGMSIEELGEALAEACFSGATGAWSHPFLAHNLEQLELMKKSICVHLKAENR